METVDVVVVGSGGAGLCAGAGALGAGVSVAIFEAAAVPGGTTACSGGVIHIYANELMRSAGIDDPRGAALAYMARVSYPASYDPSAPYLGLLPDDYRMLETYFDRGAEVVRRLGELGALHMGAPWLAWDGQPFPDYSEVPENLAVRGRGIQACTLDGGRGNGGELIRQLLSYAERHATLVRLGHRVVDLLIEGGAVSGVVVDDGAVCRPVRARGGVVFGSGGFAHNPELRSRFLRGPVLGGSGVPSNVGDLVSMAARVGARFGGMHNGWWDQQVLEAVDDYANSVLDVWAVPGDSMILVNRFGERAVGEKRDYHSRGRVHHAFVGDEYPNRVMFMIYDERCAVVFGGRYPIPPAGAVARHVVSAVGVAGLSEAIAAHLVGTAMPAGIGAVALAPGFADMLQATISRFNEMARCGVDAEFGRGRTAVEVAFHGPPAPDNPYPNPLLHPIDCAGRLFAIAIVGTTFDTNSGPRTDAVGRVLGPHGPIPGLYGAGNCVNPVFGEGYPGGGSTIGPGLVFGFLAGTDAAQRVREPR